MGGPAGPYARRVESLPSSILRSTFASGPVRPPSVNLGHCAVGDPDLDILVSGRRRGDQHPKDLGAILILLLHRAGGTLGRQGGNLLRLIRAHRSIDSE